MPQKWNYIYFIGYIFLFIYEAEIKDLKNVYSCCKRNLKNITNYISTKLQFKMYFGPCLCKKMS